MDRKNELRLALGDIMKFVSPQILNHIEDKRFDNFMKVIGGGEQRAILNELDDSILDFINNS